MNKKPVKVNPRERQAPAPVERVGLTPPQLQAGREWLDRYDQWDGLCLDPAAERADIKQASIDMMGAWTELLNVCDGDMDIAQNSVRRARIDTNTTMGKSKTTPSLRFYNPATWSEN